MDAEIDHEVELDDSEFESQMFALDAMTVELADKHSLNPTVDNGRLWVRALRAAEDFRYGGGEFGHGMASSDHHERSRAREKWVQSQFGGVDDGGLSDENLASYFVPADIRESLRSLLKQEFGRLTEHAALLDNGGLEQECYDMGEDGALDAAWSTTMDPRDFDWLPYHAMDMLHDYVRSESERACEGSQKPISVKVGYDCDGVLVSLYADVEPSTLIPQSEKNAWSAGIRLESDDKRQLMVIDTYSGQTMRLTYQFLVPCDRDTWDAFHLRCDWEKVYPEYEAERLACLEEAEGDD